MHSYAVEGIVDLTANCGVAALCAVRQKKPYLGVCFSEEHLREMRHCVTKRTFAAFQKVGDKLYQPTMNKRPSQDQYEEPEQTQTRGKDEKSDGKYVAPKKMPRKGNTADTTPDAKRALLLSKLRAMDDDPTA